MGVRAFASVCVVLGLAIACAQKPPRLAPVTLLDLDGGPFAAPGEARRAATVFLFARTDCPIANRYAPEVQRIVATYGPRDVAFFMVYVDPAEGAERIRAHRKEYGYTFPALRDPRHDLVRAVEARVTPSAAVVDRDGRLVYRGRIDDATPQYGVARPAVSHDLEAALDAVLAGRGVAVPVTDAVGCYISDVK